MTTPFDTPGAYDYFTLDGEKSPLCYITVGGHRIQQVQKMQAPGFGGAFTVFRIEEISEVEYEFPAWNAAQYKLIETFAEKMAAGARKRPVKAYKFLDLRLRHIGIKQVSPFDLGPLDKAKGSQMRRFTCKFIESKKLAPFGGVPSAAPVGERQTLIAGQKAERDANAARLASETARLRGGG
jgi:hypothetical protein